MATLNISLSEENRRFVDDQVSTQGLKSASEYLDKVLKNQREIAEFRQKILDGMNSAPGVVADEAFFDKLRDRARGRSGR